MKSKTHIHRFLLTPLLDSLKEQVALIEGLDGYFLALPLYSSTMDHLFLGLTGLLEQKITTFHWYFGLYEISLRDTIKKDMQSQAIGKDALEKNYLDLLKCRDTMANTLSHTSKSDLWEDDAKLQLAHEHIKNCFCDSLLCNFERRAFNEFVSDYPTSCSSWKLGKKRYEQFINYRHQLAHNFLAPSSDMPKFSCFISDDNKYINHFYRLTLAVYIDYKFTDLYKIILEHHAGHFF